MLLQLTNLGKIETAELEINGITVITGENNSSKSTIGKHLFALFSSLTDIDERITNSKIDAIYNILRRNSDHTHSDDYYLEKAKKLIITKHSDIDLEKNVDGQIRQVLNIANAKVGKEIIQRHFNKIFKNQNINFEKQRIADISLSVKNTDFYISFDNNKCDNYSRQRNITNKAFYIKNPSILDELNKPKYESRLSENSNVYQDENEMLVTALESSDSNNAVDRLIRKDKLLMIYEKLDDIIQGDICVEHGQYMLNLKKSKTKINFNNLASGLKPFVILKMLLENSSLKTNDILILDEPETSLNPKWQIIYAEILVLLQKELDLKILITTHSPYFLKAIHLYSQKYELKNKPDLYYSKACEDKDVITRANIKTLYKELLDPLKTLINIEYGLNKTK